MNEWHPCDSSWHWIVAESDVGAPKFDPEAASFPRVRLKPDLATHTLGSFPHNGESNARAWIALVEALKHLEDLVPILVFRCLCRILEPKGAPILFRSKTRGTHQMFGLIKDLCANADSGQMPGATNFTALLRGRKRTE